MTSTTDYNPSLPTSLVPARILISGGASGIGLATAKAFLDSGSSGVGILTRTQRSLDAALAGDLAHDADRVVAVQVDVRDGAALQQAVESVANRLGGIDAVVASAGIEGSFGANVPDITRQEFAEVFDVNVTGAFEIVRLALPYLQHSSSPSVTFVGSDSGFVAARGMITYNAAKGALVQLTRALALELFDEHGIRVNSVCPSIVDTPMARRAMEVDSFTGAQFPVNSAADVAWCVQVLASPRSRTLNGVNLMSDFGYSGRSSFPA